MVAYKRGSHTVWDCKYHLVWVTMHLGGTAVFAAAAPSIAFAQSYPTRTVRVIVGFAAGGTTDIAGRLIGHWLSEQFGQQFVIENRTGAATNIATEAVVRAPADGYTLLVVTASNAINATLYDKLNFNFVSDIAPVAGLIRYPLVMQVHPSFPAKTVSDFINYAKSNPGEDQLRIGRQRHVNPFRNRVVQNDGWGGHDPCALSWRCARDDRSDGRANTGGVQHFA
jgi:tripartite-type tricarboxylate transporter receptor subunit TctC